MKKLISLILASFMSLSLCTNIVLASDASLQITNIERNVVSDTVTVKGKMNYTRGEMPLVMIVERIKDESGADVNEFVFAVDGITTPIKNDDNMSDDNLFTIDRFSFTGDMGTGTYKFTVHTRYLDESAFTTLDYVSRQELFDFINGLKTKKGEYESAANDEAKKAVLTSATELISNYSSRIGMVAEYHSKSPSAKNLVSKLAISVDYDIPATWETTEANISKLADAMDDFAEACADGMVFAELYDCYVQNDEVTSKARFDQWYEDNKGTYNLTGDNGLANIDEADFMKDHVNDVEDGAFTKYHDTENFYKRLPAIAEKLSTSTLQKDIIDAVILSEVDNDNNNATTLGSFLTPYVQYIGINYGSANSNQKSVAHAAVCGQYYDTLSNLATAIENAIPQGIQGGNNNNNDNSGIFNGNTSMGNTAGVVTGVVNNGTSEPVSSDEAPFEDIENYGWAKDAIDFLYRRSIISGRDEKTFDPAGLVTRAEFIKMLVATYNFAVEDYQDFKFNDIVGGEWYAIFVKKAAAMGIVTGDENGNFNPNHTITRQDMAVTVHRASKFPAATDELPFDDKSQISSYALSAVGSLYEKGVVSGMGDKKFAPLENVTRAQAAQILYNVLIETKK